MKRSNNLQDIAYWLNKSDINSYFSSQNLDFSIFEYEKGEFITYSGQKLEYILFVVKGTVRIYGIRKDGSLSPVNQQKAPTILGDVEFSNQEAPPFITEAATAVICLALQIKPHAEQLHSDVRFLHTLLRSYAEIIKELSNINISAGTIEERVYVYLKNVAPNHELDGVDAATLQLRCSRRQLQRALKKLCDEGKISKQGKGKYRLEQSV